MPNGFERFDVAMQCGLPNGVDYSPYTEEELGKMYWALRDHLDTISDGNVKWLIDKMELILKEYEKRRHR